MVKNHSCAGLIAVPGFGGGSFSSTTSQAGAPGAGGLV